MRLSTHSGHEKTNARWCMKSKYTQNTKKNSNKQRRKAYRHGLGELDQVATEIDKLCREMLPDGRIRSGILSGS